MPPANDGGCFQPRVRVKICGITNRADAEAAIEAGADALGFNGFPGSKRYLDFEKEADWLTQLPPFVMRVAVLVNPTVEEAERLLQFPGIDLLQFHGDETPEFCARFGRHGYVKALAARNRNALESCRAYQASAVLLDAYVPGAYGGTGQLIDLELASGFVRDNADVKVILSGGLTVENVAGAVRAVRPWAVDVASGVEGDTPRRKDWAKMRDFVQAVREA